MVVTPTSGPSANPWRTTARVVAWAAMAAAVFWTLLFQANARAGRPPEFTYVNF